MSAPLGDFVGLTTLDIVYRVDGTPQPNTKNVVREVGLFAGGPAANAAVAFAALGGEVRLTTAIGRHAFGMIARRDLEQHGVEVIDLIPDFEGLPSMASVMISTPGGDRTVVSTGGNAHPELPQPSDLFDGPRPQVVMIDGHLQGVSAGAARQAKRAGIPVVIDAGGWKQELESSLESTDYAVCGEEFMPPGCATPADVFEHLRAQGVAYSAITRGERPILLESSEVPVAAVDAVDTLGAGDIFHGAFCYQLASGEPSFEAALQYASKIAGLACQSFGTRAWIERARY